MAGHLRANSNVRFVGFVDDKPLGQNNVVGNLEALPELCRIHHVSRVVVCFSRTHPEHLTDILKKLSGQVAISVVPRYYELITSRTVVEDLSTPVGKILKPLFDLVWNACGYPSSENFDAEGNWIGRR